MQKIINVLAITSFVVSGAVVGGGFYLYSQKDAIIEDIKEKALGSVLGGGGALGGAGKLPKMAEPDFGNLGAPDLAPSPSPDQAARPEVMGPAAGNIGPR
tara:strand:- start:2293 stop:2592 length:300 start_codon:yes stop_codon:yes gene_type:complete